VRIPGFVLMKMAYICCIRVVDSVEQLSQFCLTMDDGLVYGDSIQEKNIDIR
jgi:hypothetical protein